MASLLNMSGGSLLNKGLLPSGYKQLEYIENTSNAYIDTGLDVGQYNKFGYELKLYTKGGTSTNESNPFGFAERPSGGDVNSSQFSISRGQENGPYRFAFGYNYVISTIDLISSNEPVVINFDGNSVTCDSYSQQSNIPDSYIVNNKIVYLFGWKRYAPNSSITNCKCKFYYAKFYYNGVKTRNFIPCINPNNVVGMYDTVGQQFYSSPNGTAFIAGPEV